MVDKVLPIDHAVRHDFGSMEDAPIKILTFDANKLLIAAGPSLSIFDENHCCVQVFRMMDSIQNIRFDEKTNSYVILYKKSGSHAIRITKIQNEESKEDEFELLDVMKSWNGITEPSSQIIRKSEIDEE